MRKIRFICVALALVALVIATVAARITGTIGGLLAVLPVAIGAIVMVFDCFTDISTAAGRRSTLHALLAFAALAALSAVIGPLVALVTGAEFAILAIVVGLASLYPATLRASRRRRFDARVYFTD